MNNDVKSEIDVLIDYIKNSKIYIDYIDILNKVDKCTDIKKLTNDIRILNKKLVRTPSIELENELKCKENELNSIPLYVDYIERLEELNNLLVIVKNKIDNLVKDILL